ncbi:hypothetical protein [Clostridium tagluense]|uniref:hypothetical protein n=1 Tax=Clostridium tagluense TaxID=360422 RepID=UPI001CF29B63|nr:hypothetical protein [Clostridium tagluense]MCB2300945.1 hypothetical protein [Clostridium tagluense]
MEIGKRIIYDKATGKVLNNTFEEMSGSLQEGLRPLQMDYLDLPYGDTTLKEIDQYHIDVINKTIVVDSRTIHTQTEEEKIVELQNKLLESEGVI